jgi:hypothetical protein
MIVNTNQWNSGLYQIMMISKEGVKRNIQVVK